MRPSADGSSPHTRGAHGFGAAFEEGIGIIPAYAGSTPCPAPAGGRGQDHPRIRGEHCEGKLGWGVPCGSSPHTRGAPTCRRCADVDRRIIPAYAGSTGPGVFDPPRGRDHPRIRGEHAVEVDSADQVGGSSPHTRGALHWPVSGPTEDRDHPRIRGEHETRPVSITVNTGSSPHTRGAPVVPLPGATLAWDHPRIRGEHGSRSAPPPGPRGSSPHTRGAPPRRARRRCAQRIIPAYAGSTIKGLWDGIKSGDHPRIRGEHFQVYRERHYACGSSPHTRGALKLRRGVVIAGRIIPAYAGSTSRRCPARPSRADHPRIRGEHMLLPIVTKVTGGSSPHTRGARHPPISQTGPVGIIPAYAGSTSLSGTKTRTLSDHPRIRGEHVIKIGADLSAQGSSPHTRGAPHFSFPPKSSKRIIPAYAGSTSPPSAAWHGRADHPRIRGEHGPREEARAERRRKKGPGGGIIPAYAGSTH